MRVHECMSVHTYTYIILSLKTFLPKVESKDVVKWLLKIIILI